MVPFAPSAPMVMAEVRSEVDSLVGSIGQSQHLLLQALHLLRKRLAVGGGHGAIRTFRADGNGRGQIGGRLPRRKYWPVPASAAASPAPVAQAPGGRRWTWCHSHLPRRW